MTATGEPIAAGQTGTLEDPLAEALRVVEICERRGLVVRLMGGLAFHARMPEWTARVGRARKDIDIATRGKDRKGVSELLSREGYLGDKQYNALYGHKQLYFVDVAHNRPMDVLVDRLEMCHKLELAPRLEVDRPTLPLADLLLTKLQIVRLNEKDVRDIVTLLDGVAVSDTAMPGAIDAGYIAGLCAGDWGLFHDVGLTLQAVTERVERFGLSAAQVATVRQGLARLVAAMSEAPKTTRFRLRARIGTRARWHNEPDEQG